MCIPSYCVFEFLIPCLHPLSEPASNFLMISNVTVDLHVDFVNTASVLQTAKSCLVAPILCFLCGQFGLASKQPNIHCVVTV